MAKAAGSRWATRFMTAATIVVSVAVGATLASNTLLRLAFALVVCVLGTSITLTSRSGGLVFLATWLSLMGLIRRTLPGAFLGGIFDPLLLVATVLLLVLMLGPERTSRPSALTYSVIGLQTLIVLSVLNPLQGGISVGVVALLFTFVPILGFWVGRHSSRQSVIRVFQALAILAIPAALYGLFQSIAGLPPWDAAWVKERGYAALIVGGTVRGFSTFSSAAEYVNFVGLGLLGGWFLWKRFLLLRWVATVLMLVAIAYGANRTIVVALTVAAGLVIAAQRGFDAWKALVTAGVFIVALPVTLAFVVPWLPGTVTESPLLRHQFTGLSDPFGPSSSLETHLDLAWNGFQVLPSFPLGRGVGVVTLATTRLASDRSDQIVANTEFDPSNAAVAMGVPGLVAYLLVFALGFTKAYRQAASRRDPLFVLCLAALALTTFQWLNGGQYAVAWVPWFILGWVDSMEMASSITEASNRSQVDVPDGSPVTASR